MSRSEYKNIYEAYIDNTYQTYGQYGSSCGTTVAPVMEKYTNYTAVSYKYGTKTNDTKSTTWSK
jgi:hypothetical protein